MMMASSAIIPPRNNTHPRPSATNRWQSWRSAMLAAFSLPRRVRPPGETVICWAAVEPKAKILLFATAISAAAWPLSCGGGESQVTGVVTRSQTPAMSITKTQSDYETLTTPVMPNVDPAAAAAAEAAAVTAYEARWGDGSGAAAVWGPNIVSGWALMGIENYSGTASMDVLLQQEGSAWVVRDMGEDLAGQWQGRAPAGLWP